MSRLARWITYILAFALIYAGASSANAAATFPNKPVRLIIPFAPGGATDVIGRYIAQKVTQELGQQVITDNRPGSGGVIACEIAAKASPDGYTILMGTNGTHAINVGLYKKLPYDPLKDFQAITRAVILTNVLAVNPSVPAKSVKELIQLAKNRPGELKFGSSGNGAPPHLSGELFKSMAHVDIIHVPYKGGGPANIALLSGEVDMTFNTLTTSLPHIGEGKIRPLGVTSLKRSEALPEVPTIAEAGIPGYESTTWYGMFAPAGTPDATIDRLHSALTVVLKAPETKQRFAAMGAEPVLDTPAELVAIIKHDIPKWRKVIAAAGAQVD
jgi:tripartite-type tricarboxylate transporter receptor subunit TctC